jgi:RND family efflux transporter MFP subunit
MKKLLSIAILAVVLSGCADELEMKKKMLDEKKAELEAIKTEIKQLEEEIAQMEGGEEEAASGKPVTVTAAVVKPYNHKVTIQGVASSKENVNVSPEYSGLITQILVEEGQVISAGTTIAKIDNSILQQNLQEIETALDLARTVYEKQEKLWNQNIGSEIQYLEAKNNVESLEKKKATLEAQIQKTTIVAPISGTVDAIFPNPGEMAAPGQPFARIVDLDNMQIHADVPENYLPYVKQGEDVNIYFPALDRSMESKVKTVGQFIHPNNRTFEIILSIENEDGMIKPNLMAQIEIPTIQVDSALVIPSEIVQNSSAGDYIYVTDPSGQHALKRFISVKDNFQGEAWIENQEGSVQAGDRVIMLGYRDVNDSTHIQITGK